MSLLILRSDARSIPLLDNSVDCVCTSPPYWSLRDYGLKPMVWGGAAWCEHEWIETINVKAKNDKIRWIDSMRADEAEPEPVSMTRGSFCRCGAWLGSLGLEPDPALYVEHIVSIFREVKRVLKPTGTCWGNWGDSYAGSWGAQSRTNSSDRGCTLEGGSMLSARQIQAHPKGTHTGSLKNTPVLKPKDLVGIPWRCAFALQADGWWLRSDIIWSKPNPMPESVRDRPTRAHEYLFLMARSERYYYDADAIREPYAPSTLVEFESPYEGLGLKDYESAGVQNPSDLKRRIVDKQRGHSRRHAGFNERWDREAHERIQQHRDEARENGCDHDNPFGRGANKRSVWTIPTAPYAEAHFATFPEALVRPCILASCPRGGIVLDPFGGSGTVGKVALELGRKAILCDLKYHDLAIKRTSEVAVTLPLEVPP